MSSNEFEGTPNDDTTISVTKRKRNCSSDAWIHFKKISSYPSKTKCLYCGVEYVCGSKKGTFNLLAHIKERCTKYPGREDKKQKTLCFQPIKTREGVGKLVAMNYSVEACREAVVKFIIKDGMPFKVVEGEGFKDILKVFESRFNVYSRITITRDVLQFYKREKQDLRNFFIKSGQRVCLTTDTWTSVQNLNYMCLIAHYIDDNWRLQKNILNFCQIADHRGEIIDKQIKTCLLDSSIERVFTITVDNSTSNDVAVSYLAKIVANWNEAILGNQFMHLRCSAHILNLVVTEGLKDYNESISKIRYVVKFVRASPSRLQKFKTYVE